MFLNSVVLDSLGTMCRSDFSTWASGLVCSLVVRLSETARLPGERFCNSPTKGGANLYGSSHSQNLTLQAALLYEIRCGRQRSCLPRLPVAAAFTEEHGSLSLSQLPRKWRRDADMQVRNAFKAAEGLQGHSIQWNVVRSSNHVGRVALV